MLLVVNAAPTIPESSRDADVAAFDDDGGVQFIGSGIVQPDARPFAVQQSASRQREFFQQRFEIGGDRQQPGDFENLLHVGGGKSDRICVSNGVGFRNHG